MATDVYGLAFTFNIDEDLIRKDFGDIKVLQNGLESVKKMLISK